MKSKLLIIVAIGLVVIGGGIAIYNSTQPDLSNETEGVSGSTSDEDEGPSTDSGLGLPASFPKDFPVFSGAELESSYDSKGEEVEATSVIWIAQGSLKEISDFYGEELQSRGWKVESVLVDEESATFSFERGDSFGFIGVGKQDGESVIISVTIGARFESPSI